MRSVQLVLDTLLFLGLSASALAQQRTFVSGTGVDANPCSRAAPCRTFARAISQTSPAGEVIVLDSAGYGPVTISQSVSIISPPGVYAGISVASGDGIDISAAPSDTVILRGLTINNQGSNGSGIVFSSGGTLHVENCVASGFSSASSAGVVFNGSGKLEISDSIARGNFDGIAIGGGALNNDAFASIVNVLLSGNSDAGLLAGSFLLAAIRGSVASNNATGLKGLGDALFLTIETCLVDNNSKDGIRFQSKTGSFAAFGLIGNSTVTHNTVGLNVDASAVLNSFGNNLLGDNATDRMGLLMHVTTQ